MACFRLGGQVSQQKPFIGEQRYQMKYRSRMRSRIIPFLSLIYLTCGCEGGGGNRKSTYVDKPGVPFPEVKQQYLDLSPSISAAGSRFILLTGVEGGSFKVQTAEFDLGADKQAPNDLSEGDKVPLVESAVLRPDGTRIGYSTLKDGVPALAEADFDGTAVESGFVLPSEPQLASLRTLAYSGDGLILVSEGTASGSEGILLSTNGTSVYLAGFYWIGWLQSETGYSLLALSGQDSKLYSLNFDTTLAVDATAFVAWNSDVEFTDPAKLSTGSIGVLGTIGLNPDAQTLVEPLGNTDPKVYRSQVKEKMVLLDSNGAVQEGDFVLSGHQLNLLSQSGNSSFAVGLSRVLIECGVDQPPRDFVLQGMHEIADPKAAAAWVFPYYRGDLESFGVTADPCQTDIFGSNDPGFLFRAIQSFVLNEQSSADNWRSVFVSYDSTDPEIYVLDKKDGQFSIHRMTTNSPPK